MCRIIYNVYNISTLAPGHLGLILRSAKPNLGYYFYNWYVNVSCHKDFFIVLVYTSHIQVTSEGGISITPCTHVF
jgi:hypothetical protein